MCLRMCLSVSLRVCQCIRVCVFPLMCKCFFVSIPVYLYMCLRINVNEKKKSEIYK